jgi:hypothetical protein
VARPLNFVRRGCQVLGGNNVVRIVCVLALAVVASGVGERSVAANGEQLFVRRPDRLLIESGKRVSDGRKLQKDADTSLRRAEDGASVGNGSGVVDQGDDGSTRTRAAALEESTTSEVRR